MNFRKNSGRTFTNALKKRAQRINILYLHDERENVTRRLSSISDREIIISHAVGRSTVSASAARGKSRVTITDDDDDNNK